MNRTDAESTARMHLPLKDEVYIRRLKHDIEALTVYLQQADNALEKLESQASDINEKADPAYLEKLDLVALYDARARIPFISGKDEVLDVALTSCILQDRLKSTQDSIDWLESEIDVSKQSLAVNESQVDSAFKRASNTRIQQLYAENARLDAEMLALAADHDVYVTNVFRTLDTSIAQAAQWNFELKLHLKRVALKHLAIQSWNNNQNLNSSTLREAVHDIMATLDSLLRCQPQVWCPVLSSAHVDVLLEALAAHDVIEMKPDSDSPILLARLRDFLEI